MCFKNSFQTALVRNRNFSRWEKETSSKNYNDRKLHSIFIIFFCIFSFFNCLKGGEEQQFLLNFFITTDPPITNLKYSIPSYQYAKLVPIPTLRPSIQGTPTNYSVSPSLPRGITINPKTGFISGTPLEVLSVSEFTITASNFGNETTTVLSLTPTVSQWGNAAFTKASNSDIADYYGNAVAIDGDTMVVGAYLECSNQTTITNGATSSSDNSADSSGAVYVYKRTNGIWEQEAYLKASNAETGDWFGYSVAISGDTIVVGAYFESSNQTSVTNGAPASADNTAGGAGAAYVYHRTGTTWTEEAYLKASNAEAGDSFGYSVAINGDTIVVGAIGEASNQITITNGAVASADNSAVGAGAVYVYKRTGTNWAEEAYLKASNAEAGDSFGFGVAVNGDTIAVGAIGEASNQITITNGNTSSADNTAWSAGAVYVYNRTGTNWAQESYLKADSAPTGYQLGYSVALEGNTIVAGAPGAAEGIVYVFLRTGVSWVQQGSIIPSNPVSVILFGYSVALSGETVAIGTYWENGNENRIVNGTTASTDNTLAESGATYVYKRTGTTWTQESYIKAKNVQSGDWFGMSVGISGDTVIAGAPQEDSGQNTIAQGTLENWNEGKPNSGAVYVFNR
ncbi:FG-GAP repeat protein [Leptospira sp. 201903071]|uniref:putative Ig domain-containing protein n=1 Tax=Leptospira ainazelensis TaxID=2810034 RepID=UPI0019654466|nr:putative Ig domain-containing protein [Leptospira ainazelensis]MBM9502708.1 FG-GAP repeat protein [Leptospira ainazelensis]